MNMNVKVNNFQNIKKIFTEVYLNMCILRGEWGYQILSLLI